MLGAITHIPLASEWFQPEVSAGISGMSLYIFRMCFIVLPILFARGELTVCMRWSHLSYVILRNGMSPTQRFIYMDTSNSIPGFNVSIIGVPCLPNHSERQAQFRAKPALALRHSRIQSQSGANEKPPCTCSGYCNGTRSFSALAYTQVLDMF